MNLAFKMLSTMTFGLLSLLVTATPNAVWAQRTLADISARSQINIGYREDAAPFSYMGSDGKPLGYMLDACRWVVDRVEQRLARKVRVNYVPIAVDQVIRRVQSGSVHLMCSATSDVAVRREHVAFSHPLFVESVKLATRAADRIENVGQLRGKTVVVIGRTTAETIITDQAAQRGWKVTKVLTGDAALGQLRLGWAAAYARDETLLATQLTQSSGDSGEFRFLPGALATENIAIALPKDDREWLTLVNDAIARAARDKQLHGVYETWFLKPIPGFKRALGIGMSAQMSAVVDKLR